MKLICTSVTRQAWNDEQIILEGIEAKVIIHLKDPADQGKYTQCKEYEISPVVKKSAVKKKKAK